MQPFEIAERQECKLRTVSTCRCTVRERGVRNTSFLILLSDLSPLQSAHVLVTVLPSPPQFEPSRSFEARRRSGYDCFVSFFSSSFFLGGFRSVFISYRKGASNRKPSPRNKPALPIRAGRPLSESMLKVLFSASSLAKQMSGVIANRRNGHLTYLTKWLFARMGHMKCIRLVPCVQVTSHLKYITCVQVSMYFRRRANSHDHDLTVSMTDAAMLQVTAAAEKQAISAER